VLCLSLWIRAKTVDQEERGNAERRAIFVGLWPPMLWLIGNALQQHEDGAGAHAQRSGLKRVGSSVTEAMRWARR
jgi:hypothetical protein